MNHNYKLADFNNIAKEVDTDIKERIVTINLWNVSKMPLILKERLESIINSLIAGYEHRNNTILSLENMELGIYLNIDTLENELSIVAYIGYSIDEECLHSKEVIAVNDAGYHIIKKYFFNELDNYLSGEIMRIKKCA